MGVDFFSCENCKEVRSEYNEIYCEKCESHLCKCVIPEELKKYINIWEDVWEYITTDDEDNIIPADNSEYDEEVVELFKKYLTYNSETYGLLLKKEYCPVCKLREELNEDPEYKNYLRLKKKFEDPEYRDHLRLKKKFEF